MQFFFCAKSAWAKAGAAPNALNATSVAARVGMELVRCVMASS
jgi:hypothetical protein